MMDKVLKLYKNLSQTQSLISAKVLQNGVINSFWSQRNIETGKNVKCMRVQFVDSKLNKIAETLPFDVSNEVLSAISSSEKNRAVLREVSNGKETRNQYLEIWTNNSLTHAVDLTALNVHGNVYADEEFKAFAWSPDETKIMYIAEKKLANREAFYKRKTDKVDDNEDKVAPAKGDEYNFRQDWGEQLVGKYTPIIAIYDLEKDNVIILEGVPENLNPGQVAWSPDGAYIVGLALETEPRKLGLIYCRNRPAVIFKLDFSGNYEQLSQSERTVASPIFSPDGKYLIWLEKEVGGPHMAALALMRFEISNPTKPNVVLDIIQNSVTTKNNELFYGLFNSGFPKRCWANDNRRLFFSTPQKYAVKTYSINIESRDLTELKFNAGSQIILDVYNDTLLLSRKNYLHSDKLIIAQLPKEGDEDSIEWKELISHGNIKLLKNMKYEYMDITRDGEDKVKDFTAIYFGPKTGGNKKTPLLLWPHGGPHSVFCNTFALEPSILISLGFAIVFINYRGSIGFGQSNVNYLLGRVGDADVKDCILAAEECIKKFPWINPNNLALVGGSHGGFLVHHLSGQYPDMFKAVVSRNPVIDIASMSVISDIADWGVVEAGGAYTQKGKVDDELFMTMRKVSPIEHAHKIKAPTYFMLGSKDLRVPCSQGLELYYRLKANGVPCKVNMYEDNHSLAAISNEMDHIINSALWLLKHTK